MKVKFINYLKEIHGEDCEVSPITFRYVHLHDIELPDKICGFSVKRDDKIIQYRLNEYEFNSEFGHITFFSQLYQEIYDNIKLKRGNDRINTGTSEPTPWTIRILEETKSQEKTK